MVTQKFILELFRGKKIPLPVDELVTKEVKELVELVESAEDLTLLSADDKEKLGRLLDSTAKKKELISRELVHVNDYLRQELDYLQSTRTRITELQLKKTKAEEELRVLEDMSHSSVDLTAFENYLVNQDFYTLNYVGTSVISFSIKAFRLKHEFDCDLQGRVTLSAAMLGPYELEISVGDRPGIKLHAKNTTPVVYSEELTAWEEVVDDEEIDLSDVYIHPHVCDGSICYGDGIDAYKGFKSNPYDLSYLTNILDTTRAVLTQYNHESPYCELSYFDCDFEVKLAFTKTGGTAVVPVLTDNSEGSTDGEESNFAPGIIVDTYEDDVNHRLWYRSSEREMTSIHNPLGCAPLKYKLGIRG